MAPIALFRLDKATIGVLIGAKLQTNRLTIAVILGCQLLRAGDRIADRRACTARQDK